MVIPKIISRFLHAFFPSLIFRYSGQDKRLYLTFDDGPSPVITEFILKCLKEYNAKATFFCMGKNVKAYPELFHQITLSENKTGNHSWKHSDAFLVSNFRYMNDIDQAQELIGSPLFRPPYGKLWPWQINRLDKKYQIIMWEVMFPDYKAELDCEKAIARLFPKISNGSIIVMHDSVRAFKQMGYILPRLLEEFTNKGFIFATIPLPD
jgi:peptidoglycan/xylan/chitin deacetylase (PgdA/CDA1 family)